ncbi:MAG: ABC transporter permease [Clostridia bacterium]|nr:ABC transporter permease [Clostridia bacterium]
MNNNTKNILKKELRRTFRDKKSLLMMLLVPIIIPAFIIGMAAFYNMMGNKNPEDYNKIGFAYELTEEEKAIAKELKIDVINGTEDNFKEMYKNKEIDLYITKNSNTYTINTNNSTNAAYAETLASTYFEALKNNLQAQILANNDINAVEFFTMVNVDKKVVEEESMMGSMLKSYGFLFCIMAITIAASYPATDTTAGEKERGTLETLLTFPIKARDIIVGKFLCVSISSIITGILSFTLSIVSLNVVQNSFEMFKGGGITYNVSTILCGIALIIAYGILISGISIAVASKSKTFKEAQSSLTLVMFLSFFPGMICSMISVKTTFGLALVPFLNTALIFNDATTGIFNITNIVAAFVTSIIYIAIVLYVIIKQYKSEKVLFS